MSVKLRPGTHYVQVERGVLVAQRDTSFVLSGPPALYRLIDDNVGLLLDGTDATALAEAVGDPAAVPVFEHIIATLVERDVMFEMAAGAPAPSATDRQRFARTLSYCEAQCADPYQAFAAVRTARVAVVGDGPAAEPVLRALRSMGVGDVGRQIAGATLVVLIDDLAGSDQATSETAVLPVLPVLTGPQLAVVGPVAAGAAVPDTLTWTAALADRAAHWVAAEPDEAAPWPLSAVLAGSLAARAVLDRLLGLASPEPGATVVHGRLLATTVVPVAAGRVPPAEATELISAAGSTGHAGELLAGTTALTSRFAGPIRRGSDEDLPQLPMSLASAQVLDTPGRPSVLGWGPDRGAAGLDAVLRASRLRASRLWTDGLWTDGLWTDGLWTDGLGAAAGADAGRAVGAGLSRQWAELDGRLRLLGAELAARPTATPISWSELATSRPRALWSLLEDFYGRRIEVAAQQLTGGSWTLVTVQFGDDHPCRHWGFSVDAGVFAALGECVARLQSPPEQAAALRSERIGTQALSWTPARQLAAGIAATDLAAAERDGAWQSSWHAEDEVLGALPVWLGLTWLR